jgi:hypothetical protein
LSNKKLKERIAPACREANEEIVIMGVTASGVKLQDTGLELERLMKPVN